MKKIHRKIIKTQARYLDKIVKDIRYLKKVVSLKGDAGGAIAVKNVLI